MALVAGSQGQGAWGVGFWRELLSNCVLPRQRQKERASAVSSGKGTGPTKATPPS